MSNNENGNRGIDDPTPPNGVKAPGKHEDLLQGGPAQDTGVDDNDGIEDQIGEQDDAQASF